MQYINSVCKLPPDIGVPIGSPLGLHHQKSSRLNSKMIFFNRPINYAPTSPFGEATSMPYCVSGQAQANALYLSIQFTLEDGGERINILDLSISLLPDSFAEPFLRILTGG